MAMLYHYTTAAGLLGMLKRDDNNKVVLRMRATHSMYLNDPTEYQYGKMVCKRALMEVEEELGIKDNKFSDIIYDNDKEKSRDFLDFAFSAIPSKLENGIPYIISLSKAKDNLSMWNTYAHNGNGIALGFNSRKLGYIDGIEVQDCYYDDITDNSFCKQYNELKEKLRIQYGKRNEFTKYEILDLILDTHIHILHKSFAPFIKHKGYNYEQEVRCVVKGDNRNIEFRESNGLIIPYIEQDIDIRCLEKIVIGPVLDSERMLASLTILLSNYGVLNAKKPIKNFIEISDIPYRG